MSRRLLTYLEANDAMTPLYLDRLRRTTEESIDVAILADMITRGHRAMRRLGLDPQDTTAVELYRALLALAASQRVTDILEDTEFVLVELDGHVISLNPLDVVDNYHHELPLVKASRTAAKRGLGWEITKRYRDHPQTHNQTVEKIADKAGLPMDAPQKTVQTADTSAPRVLAVGDIITDAFIKLSEDHAQVTTDDEGYQRLSFELGAKLPYDEVDIVKAVECSPNAAVSMTRLGLKADLMTWIGNDEAGDEMVRYLREQGVGTEDIIVEKGKASNYHYVLRYGADRTKLQKFEDYAYEWHEPVKKPDWLYLGVLGEKTWPLHEHIMEYLETHPEIKLCFQPGMYHLMWGAEKLAKFYRRAEIVIMNREEAAQVTERSRESVSGLIEGLHDLGVTVAVVTDGPDGAYASKQGEQILFMPNYPDPAKPLDRTGAGDAFASTITAALALGESLETALEWAPINSMSVVQKMGAQTGLLTRDKLEMWLKKAPADYDAVPFTES